MKRALAVKAMDNYLLLVKFDNGEQKVYNCFPLLQNKLFSELKKIEFFKTVHIDEMGVVCWSDSTDINPYDLYENSESLTDFSFSNEQLKETTLQTAELLDILPDKDVSTVNALSKELIIAWDPDFTKVTERERELLEQSDSEMKKGDFVSEEDFWR